MRPYFKRGKSRILSKMLLGTGILVFASVICLSSFFLLRHKAAFQEQLRLRAESLAASLAGQAQFALLLENRTELTQLARLALDGDRDVAYVVVEVASGKAIASAERPPLKREMLPDAPKKAGRSSFRSVSLRPGGVECIEATVSVVPKAEGGVLGLRPDEPEELGRIRVGLSLSSQDAIFLATLRQVSAIACLILLASWTAGYFQIRKLLKPLIELSASARLLGSGEEGRPQIPRTTDDEVGDLVESFNEMADQVTNRTRELSEQVVAKEAARAELAAAQQRLMDLSRQSGMAEIATNVLHNVGNVLNSVNVSATILAGKVKDSRAGKLVALAEMVNQHSDDLEQFLQRDPKGQRVLPYLDRLGRHLQQERESLLRELDLLTGHVGHIKQIVATQQNYAKVSGLLEKLCLREIVDDAIRIIEPGLERLQVTLQRDFEEIPVLVSDKHQILQILLNLLRNARQAIEDSNRQERLIRVRLRRHSQDLVRIEVKDSGVGLPPGHATRIFAHGFTTRPNGHGFGLHSGALAARQLGGSLWAESDGPGLGATFTLELPLVAARVPKERVSNETTAVT